MEQNTITVPTLNPEGSMTRQAFQFWGVGNAKVNENTTLTTSGAATIKLLSDKPPKEFPDDVILVPKAHQFDTFLYIDKMLFLVRSSVFNDVVPNFQTIIGSNVYKRFQLALLAEGQIVAVPSFELKQVEWRHILDYCNNKMMFFSSFDEMQRTYQLASQFRIEQVKRLLGKKMQKAEEDDTTFIVDDN